MDNTTVNSSLEKSLSTSESTKQSARLILNPWKGAMGGLPPLGLVNVDTLRASLSIGLEEAKTELKRLLSELSSMNGPQIVQAIDQLGMGLSRARAIYSNFSSSFSSPDLRALRKKMEPRLAAWHAEVYSTPELYLGVLKSLEQGELVGEYERFAKRLIDRFKNAGAHLDRETCAQLSEINQELSGLFSAFSDRVLSDEESLFTWLNEDQLDGLPPAWISSAQTAAADRGVSEQWLIRNTRSAVEPFLTLSPHRELRETV